MILTKEECELELRNICYKAKISILSPLRFNDYVSGYECIVYHEQLKDPQHIENLLNLIESEYVFYCRYFHEEGKVESTRIIMAMYKVGNN